MTRPLIRHPLVLSLVAVLTLAACKKKEEPAVAPAPASATPAAAPAAPAKPFDLQSVPVTTTPLPPFPYIGMPSQLKKGDLREETSGFERTYVLASNQLRQVEGKISFRSFSMSSTQMSPLGAHRNYETALKELGATRVDTVYPADEQFVAHNGGDGGGHPQEAGRVQAGAAGRAGDSGPRAVSDPHSIKQCLDFVLPFR